MLTQVNTFYRVTIRMKRIALLCLTALMLNGCALQYASEKSPKEGTTRYVGISFFNKTAVKGLKVGSRTEKSSATVSLSEGATETQEEALKQMGVMLGTAIGTAAKTAVKP